MVKSIKEVTSFGPCLSLEQSYIRARLRKEIRGEEIDYKESIISKQIKDRLTILHNTSNEIDDDDDSSFESLCEDSVQLRKVRNAANNVNDNDDDIASTESYANDSLEVIKKHNLHRYWNDSLPEEEDGEIVSSTQVTILNLQEMLINLDSSKLHSDNSNKNIIPDNSDSSIDDDDDYCHDSFCKYKYYNKSTYSNNNSSGVATSKSQHEIMNRTTLPEQHMQKAETSRAA